MADNTKKGITLRRLIHIYLFLVYTGIVLTLTIFRRPVGSREGIVHLYIKLGLGLKGGNPSLWGSTFGFYNVLLFIPLGIFIYLFFRNRCKKSGIVLATIIGAGMSLAIETTQFITGRGMFELTDLLTNTMGSLAGAALAAMISELNNRLKRSKQ